VSAEAARGPVPPGTGWPGDLATAQTPVAADPTEVVELAAGAESLNELVARQSVCRACSRLVAWRERVAVERRRSFADEQYWGRPIPGWGAEHPGVLIAGLAPAAHGGNRTGRIFTGDRSGDFLFASLYRCGLAVQPTSVTAGDGQRLLGTRMIPAVRCAPPDNKPENAERDACEPWFGAELRFIIADLRVIVCLGHYAWQAVWRDLGKAGFAVPKPRPAFGHAAEVQVNPASGSRSAGSGGGVEVSPASGSRSAGSSGGVERGDLLVLGCYHPSQQNTFTGRVTEPMLDAVFTRAAAYAGLPRP
jgi:uracil-DNA glycosylase family 4